MSTAHLLPTFARVDLAYTHLWVKDTNVNITAASGNPSFNGSVNYIGTADAHADIFSASLVVQVDALLGVQPAKTLITK